jgi:hypothetical protein
MLVDGAVSYFGAGAIPPASALFKQEAKLQGTSLCQSELPVWITKVKASCMSHLFQLPPAVFKGVFLNTTVSRHLLIGMEPMLF